MVGFCLFFFLMLGTDYTEFPHIYIYLFIVRPVDGLTDFAFANISCVMPPTKEET